MAEADPPSGNTTATRTRRATPWLRLALALWLLPLLVVTGMVIARPAKRTVTPLYHEAAANWEARKPLYQGPSGMNYLPHFAPLFLPFHALPSPWGDVFWRLAGAGLLAAGLWRAVQSDFPGDAPEKFFWATVLVLPLSLPAIRNGQANAHLAAAMLFAATCLQRKQWWSGALFLALGLAIKPLGLVMLLLAPAGYPRLRWPIAAVGLGLAAFPFLFATLDYVLAQFRDVLTNLQSCAAVSEHRFADINGILRTFGTELAPALSLSLRALGGLLVLAAWALGSRGERGNAILLLALASAYLMLANPMNEANSYVILAPAVALWTVRWIAGPASPTPGWISAFLLLSMGLLPNLLRPVFGNHFALFWHPMATLAFLGLLLLYHRPRLAPCETPDGQTA